MSKVPVLGYHCQRCGHEWLSRKNSKGEPRVCPKCKSPYWNRPRKTIETSKGKQGEKSISTENLSKTKTI